MAVTATIPNRAIPIASLNVNGQQYDLSLNEEWARFLRDIQIRSGGVTGVTPVGSGGTGFSSYTVGDILYADAVDSLARLNAAASGNALLSGAAPSWGKVGLTTHVSGVLPEANGGTGFTAFGVGVADLLQTPSSDNLRAALTDETGTGSAVFADTPTLIAPILGIPTSGNLINCTGYPTGALVGTVTVAQGGTGITAGTSGGIPYFSSSSTIASSAALAANALMLGGGAGVAPSTLGALGTTTTVLHGNAAGAPSFGAVALTTDVTGTLPVANGGTGITSFGAGIATWLGTPSSANLRSAITDETGTGALVFADTPTLVTPDIGAATGTSVSLSSTATASAFIPTGSAVPANGMYLSGANTLDFATASSNRLKIDSSGNVGFGVTPATKFQVNVASNRNVACFDQSSAATVAGLTDAGSGAALRVVGSTLTLAGTAAAGGNHLFIDTSGNSIFTMTATPPALGTNSNVVFNLTSNTNFRISARGSDGTTRVANITLA